MGSKVLGLRIESPLKRDSTYSESQGVRCTPKAKMLPCSGTRSIDHCQTYSFRSLLNSGFLPGVESGGADAGEDDDDGMRFMLPKKLLLLLSCGWNEGGGCEKTPPPLLKAATREFGVKRPPLPKSPLLVVVGVTLSPLLERFWSDPMPN